MSREKDCVISDLAAECKALRQQRDELVEALNDIAKLWEDSDRGHTNAYDMRCIARSTLTKIKESK